MKILSEQNPISRNSLNRDSLSSYGGHSSSKNTKGKCKKKHRYKDTNENTKPIALELVTVFGLSVHQFK